MPLQPSTTRHLDHLLATAQREGRLPSLAAGLVRDGELVWSGAVGTVDARPDGAAADADTQYRMGSITKTFVAVAVLRLRDAGRLELDDRFGAHVPGTALDDVTVEQLLTHAAGAQAETNGPWWERTPGVGWDALAAEVGQRFRAGRRFHYSNVGYAALGRLLEVAHGRHWFDVVRQELLEPLAMGRTTTRPSGTAARGLAVHPFADVLLPEPEHDAGAMAPAGQLWTTVRDLARWAAFLGGETAGLLAADTLAEMLEPHHVVDEPGSPWVTAHGLGWQVWNVDGARFAGHGGSMPGFLAGLRVRLDAGARSGAPGPAGGGGTPSGAASGTASGPATGMAGDGVVVLTNATASASRRSVADELLDGLARHEPAPVEPWSATGDAALLELVGTWHWGPAVQTARIVGEHLVLGEPGAGRGSRFRRTGPDAWLGLDHYFTGEPLRVVRRPDGSVSHLDIASFRFTRTPYDPGADVPGGVDERGWS